MLEPLRKELHHAAQGPRSVEGRGGSLHDVDLLEQLGLDERGGDTGTALADHPSALDHGQNPMPRDAPDRKDLEEPALSVLRHTGNLDHRLRQGARRHRRVDRLEGGRGDTHRSEAALAPVRRDDDLLEELLLGDQGDQELRRLPHLQVDDLGVKARMAGNELRRQFGIDEHESAIGVGEDVLLGTDIVDSGVLDGRTTR